MEDEKRAMKSKSIVGKLSWDHRNEIATFLADLDVLTRAQSNEFVESCMAKVNEKIKAKVVETVAETFEDAIQTSYFDSNEGLKLEMHNQKRPDRSPLCQQRSRL